MDTINIILIIFSIVLIVIIGLIIYLTVSNSSEDIDSDEKLDEPDVVNVNYQVIVSSEEEEARLLREAREGGLEESDCKNICSICKRRDYEDCDEICDQCDIYS